MKDELRALLYVSELADGVPVACVGSILSIARSRNAVHGETGVLLFDGQRFCQYVEGESSKIDALRANLLKDDRHQRVVMLADQPADRRLFADFRMGYVSLDDLDALEGVAQHIADEAIRRFMTVVGTSDIEA